MYSKTFIHKKKTIITEQEETLYIEAVMVKTHIKSFSPTQQKALTNHSPRNILYFTCVF